MYALCYWLYLYGPEIYKIYRTKFYGPVMNKIYKKKDDITEIMGKILHKFIKFGYVVELNTTNMCVEFQSILQVLLEVMVQLISY